MGDLYRCYQTSYFALEWGKLFQQGLEIRQIIMCMQQTSTATLVQELAVQLELCLASGGLLPDKLKDYVFLTPEFSLIVFQGEMRGKLGEELFVYSQLLTDRLFQQIEKKIQWIQPVIFISGPSDRGCLCCNVFADLRQYSRSDRMRKLKHQGFTLVEMLIVLLVISILILLFVPNLSAQRTVIDEKGNAAIVKVVETQIELFQLNENRTPTRQELLAGNYVTEEQYAIYLAHRNE